MNYYLLTWNPNRYNWNNIDDIIAEIEQNGYYDKFGWGCGRRTSINIGDWLFLMRLGLEPKGIVGSGYSIPSLINSKNNNIDNIVYQDDHWDTSNDNQANYVDIKLDTLINPENAEILSLYRLKKLFPNQTWKPLSSGISIVDYVAKELEISSRF